MRFLLDIGKHPILGEKTKKLRDDLKNIEESLLFLKKRMNDLKEGEKRIRDEYWTFAEGYMRSQDILTDDIYDKKDHTLTISNESNQIFITESDKNDFGRFLASMFGRDK